MPAGIYNLWVNEGQRTYNARRGLPPAWLPPEHHARWERLRQSRMLFEGRHREYFLEEGRSESDFPEADTAQGRIRPYSMFNLLKLVSVKTADLLFGAKVRLTAPTPRQTDAIDELARRSLLHSRFHAAVVGASWSGGSFLESVVWRDEPYINVPPPDEIYPLGTIQPDGQYEHYVRYATETLGPRESPITLLLESEYQPGRIVRRLFQVHRNGQQTRLSLDQWPAFSGGGGAGVPRDEEVLGIADNPITYLANEVGGRTELSDYDGLIKFQDTVNAKFTQVDRVLAQHADPAMGFPAAAANEEGNVSARHKMFFFHSRDEIPQYIVWNAQLEPAMADRAAAIHAFCIAAEMSQVLLGIKEGAAPDAARKLRLEATNTLAKVGRKGLLIEPAVARAIEVTQRLDQTTRLRRQYPVDPIGVEPRDGLPVDELDEANAIATLRARAMSLEAAVERRVEDPDAAATEVALIKAENAASAPSILGGEANEEQRSVGGDGNDEEISRAAEAA